MSHTARALVVHCMDFRFVRGIQEFLLERGFQDAFDLVSLAGSAKNIVSPAQPEDKDFALKQIELSQRLHGIQEVVLINHLDCGAYGGSKAFASAAEEHDRHAADLHAAHAVIHERFPQLGVRLLLAFLDPHNHTVGFEDVTA